MKEALRGTLLKPTIWQRLTGKTPAVDADSYSYIYMSEEEFDALIQSYKVYSPVETEKATASSEDAERVMEASEVAEAITSSEDGKKAIESSEVRGTGGIGADLFTPSMVRKFDNILTKLDVRDLSSLYKMIGISSNAEDCGDSAVREIATAYLVRIQDMHDGLSGYVASQNIAGVQNFAYIARWSIPTNPSLTACFSRDAASLEKKLQTFLTSTLDVLMGEVCLALDKGGRDCAKEY